MQTLKCAENSILYLFCPWKHIPKVGYFSRIADIFQYCQNWNLIVYLSLDFKELFKISGTTTRLCCPRGHERSTKIPNTPRRQINRPIALSSHLFQPAWFASLWNIWQAQDIPHESHTRVLWRIWLCLKTEKKISTKQTQHKEYTRIHTRFPNKGIPKWFQTMRSKKNIWKKQLISLHESS